MARRQTASCNFDSEYLSTSFHPTKAERDHKPMPSTKRTRISLLARISEQPESGSAWAEFVEIYAPHIVDLCLRYGVQEADAQDLTQDVLMRFWKQAAKFRYDPTMRFRSYLSRITHSAWAEWRNRLEPDQLQPASDAAMKRLLSEPVRDDLIARLEQAYDLELFQMALEDAEQRVEPHTWQAFKMTALDLRPGPEVAELLGMKLNTVHVARMKVQRMVQRSVQRMEQEGPTP